MEQQNHELLGLIVARQRAICDAIRVTEKKEEDRLLRRAASFADTCIGALWESVRGIAVPHYLPEREELTIPLSRYGRYIRCNETIIGIRMRRRGGGEATWRCKLDKEGKIKYVGDLVFINDALACNVTMTKQQFEQAFVEHVARIIPTDRLEHIQPVEFSARKTSRRVVAMA